MKIFVTTNPFGEPDSTPCKALESYTTVYNDVGRKFTQEELHERLKSINPDIIIAGTEKYDSQVLDLCPRLKMISRVGIGYDAVDLDECKKRGIIVTYTPDAPSNAVAELALGQMLNMLREIQDIDKEMRFGKWRRFVGRELCTCSVGIIGCGRAGSLVAKKLRAFEPKEILINDVVQEAVEALDFCKPSSKEEILKNCDIITLHLPLTEESRDFIAKKELDMMKKNSILINTSRGGIINEQNLFDWLTANPDAKAAIDTFEVEPYKGELIKLRNAYVTSHLGSCTTKSRLAMELGAAQEAINLIKKTAFNNRIA